MLKKLFSFFTKFCGKINEGNKPTEKKDLEIAVNYDDSYFFIWKNKRTLFLVLTVKNKNTDSVSCKVNVLPQGTLKDAISFNQSKGPNIFNNTPKVIKATIKNNSICFSGLCDKEESLIIYDFNYDKNFRLMFLSSEENYVVFIDLEQIKNI